MSKSLQVFANTSVTDLGTFILADSAAKACVILLMAALVVLALRKSSAALRHLTWVVAMTAVLLVPWLATVLPQSRVLPAWFVVTEPQQQSALKMEMMPEWFEEDEIGVSEMTASAVASSAINHPAPAISSSPNLFTLQYSILTVWALVAALMLLRIVLSRLVLSRLIRSADPLRSAAFSELLIEVINRLNVSRVIHVYISPRRTIPMAWGILRTYLLLPKEAKNWDTSRLRAVLLHELGHVKRRDMLTHVLTQLVCAVYWFHPLVWFASWRIHIERERACDDVVVASGMQPSEYARHLLAIINGVPPILAVPSTALAMAKLSILENRVMAILNENVCRKPLTKRLFNCALLIGLMAATVMATLHAQTSSSEKPDEGFAPENAIVQNDGAEKLKATDHKEGNSQISGADREAEVALKDLGVNIFRNDKGEVVALNFFVGVSQGNSSPTTILYMSRI